MCSDRHLPRAGRCQQRYPNSKVHTPALRRSTPGSPAQGSTTCTSRSPHNKSTVVSVYVVRLAELVDVLLTTSSVQCCDGRDLYDWTTKSTATRKLWRFQSCLGFQAMSVTVSLWRIEGRFTSASQLVNNSLRVPPRLNTGSTSGLMHISFVRRDSVAKVSTFNLSVKTTPYNRAFS